VFLTPTLACIQLETTKRDNNGDAATGAESRILLVQSHLLIGITSVRVRMAEAFRARDYILENHGEPLRRTAMDVDKQKEPPKRR